MKNKKVILISIIMITLFIIPLVKADTTTNLTLDKWFFDRMQQWIITEPDLILILNYTAPQTDNPYCEFDSINFAVEYGHTYRFDGYIKTENEFSTGFITGGARIGIDYYNDTAFINDGFNGEYVEPNNMANWIYKNITFTVENAQATNVILWLQFWDNTFNSYGVSAGKAYFTDLTFTEITNSPIATPTATPTPTPTPEETDNWLIVIGSVGGILTLMALGVIVEKLQLLENAFGGIFN